VNLAVSTWNYLCAYAHEAKLGEAIREAVGDGFGVELWLAWIADPDALNERHWDEMRQMLDGVRVSVHTGLGRWDEEAFIKELDMAASLGARVLVAHESTLGLRSEGETVRTDCCRTAAECARSKGVRLALENGTSARLLAALETTDEIEICLDIGHANLSDEGVEHYLDTFGDKIGHVHLSDNYGQTDDHLVPGDAYIAMDNWRNLLETLQGANFSGTMVFELNTTEPRKSAKRAREFIEYVARSIEADSQ
jgi:sugar phosphate isomerase/epimerase